MEENAAGAAPEWEAPLIERLASGGPKTMMALMISGEKLLPGALMRARAWVFDASLPAARRLNEALDEINGKIASTVGFVDADNDNLQPGAVEAAERMGMAMLGVCLVLGPEGGERETRAAERFERWASGEEGLVAEVSMSYANKGNRVASNELMGAALAAWEARQLRGGQAPARRGPARAI